MEPAAPRTHITLCLCQQLRLGILEAVEAPIDGLYLACCFCAHHLRPHGILVALTLFLLVLLLVALTMEVVFLSLRLLLPPAPLLHAELVPCVSLLSVLLSHLSASTNNSFVSYTHGSLFSGGADSFFAAPTHLSCGLLIFVMSSECCYYNNDGQHSCCCGCWVGRLLLPLFLELSVLLLSSVLLLFSSLHSCHHPETISYVLPCASTCLDRQRNRKF